VLLDAAGLLRQYFARYASSYASKEHSTNPVAPSRSRKAGDGIDAGGSATQEQLLESRRAPYRGRLLFAYLSLGETRESDPLAAGEWKLRLQVDGK